MFVAAFVGCLLALFAMWALRFTAGAIVEGRNQREYERQLVDAKFRDNAVMGVPAPLKLCDCPTCGAKHVDRDQRRAAP